MFLTLSFDDFIIDLNIEIKTKTNFLSYLKNFQSDSVKCCWVCVACRDNQFLKNEFTCENCPIGWRPNANLTGCIAIPVKYIQWTETPSLVAIGIATIGLLMTLFTMVVFIKHNNTPVVKASTKELSYLIMVGMLLANCTTFFLIAKPSKFNCLIARILPGFSFAVIYGSLVCVLFRFPLSDVLF